MKDRFNRKAQRLAAKAGQRTLSRDPAQLTTLRRQFASELKRGYAALGGKIVDLLVRQDALGLKDRNAATAPASPVVNAGQWSYETNSRKVERFRAWLRDQMDSTLAGDALIEKYIEQGHTKGVSRAHADTTRGRAGKSGGSSPVDELGNLVPLGGTDRVSYLGGAKAEFVRRTTRHPVTVDQVKLLAGRTFAELDGVNQVMASRMSRLLADGLVRGKTDAEIATDLVRETKVAGARAAIIVRTELARAHAEGQLNAMSALGVKSVGAAVEWTTGDAPCAMCEPLDGVILSVEEARGLLPRHPQCLCSWQAVTGPGEDSTVDAKGVRGAMKASRKAQGLPLGGKGAKDGWGGSVKVAKDRPVGNSQDTFLKEVVGYDRVLRGEVANSFCPTGEGGGIDPSCSPAASRLLAHVVANPQGVHRGKATDDLKMKRKDVKAASAELVAAGKVKDVGGTLFPVKAKAATTTTDKRGPSDDGTAARGAGTASIHEPQGGEPVREPVGLGRGGLEADTGGGAAGAYTRGGGSAAAGVPGGKGGAVGKSKAIEPKKDAAPSTPPQEQRWEGVAGTSIVRGETKVHDSGGNLSVKLSTDREMPMPDGSRLRMGGGPVAVVDAMRERDKGQITLMKVHVDEELRKKGLPRELMGELARAALREGLPVRTTGVFSSSGKEMMDKMVRDGLASKVGAGDYELNLPKLAETAWPSTQTTSPSPSSRRPSTAADVARVWGSLSGAQHNQVSIADLHERLGHADLKDTHDLINRMRREGKLFAEQIEGGRGSHARELAHAIHEHDQHLGYVGVRDEHRATFNTFCPTGEGGGVDPSCSPSSASSSKDDKSKYVGQVVGAAEQEVAAGTPVRIAEALGGKTESEVNAEEVASGRRTPGDKDKKPYDVKVPKRVSRGKVDEAAGFHDLEVKTLVNGSKQSISVHDDALLRKVEHAERNPANTFHTVVRDARAEYGGGKFKESYSGHGLYYKRGSGRYALSKMYKVKDEAELGRLLNMKDDDLPEKARGRLPSGELELKKLRAGAAKAKVSRDARNKDRKERNKEKLREQARARRAKAREAKQAASSV